MAKQFNLGPLPQKYRMTYTDRNDVTKQEDLAMYPDPQDPEKVRDHLILTRNDLYLAGVTHDRLQVKSMGPMNAQELARQGSAMAGVRGPGLDPLTAPITPDTVTL